MTAQNARLLDNLGLTQAREEFQEPMAAEISYGPSMLQGSDAARLQLVETRTICREGQCVC